MIGDLHGLATELWRQSLGALESLAVLMVAALVGLATYWVLVRIARRLARASSLHWVGVLLKQAASPTRLLLPLLAAQAALPLAPASPNIMQVLGQAFSLAVTAGIGWLLVRFTWVGQEMVLSRYQLDSLDNLRARRVYTQITLLRRIVVAIVVVLTCGAMLIVFKQVRQVGTSILASAGIAGIILGFAAQKSLGTLVAGLQLAVTQPIRIDDVLVVEGEWGKVEEITMSYVVLRIWDKRRLVLPVTYFIEKPFQNWTRVSADLLGTVFIHTDYRVPVEEVRQELKRILEASELWDKEVWSLQVTNASERGVELRALMSASDSSTAWNLRCLVREKLIDYLQRNHPDSLPHTRVLLSPLPGLEPGQQEIGPQP